MTAIPTMQELPPLISPPELAGLLAMNPAVRLMDVRTPGEFESAHLSGAYNVPLDTLGEHGPGIRAAVQDPVVLVCQSGQRARRAEAALREAGMPNLHVLDGGMSGWLAAGLPAVTGRRRISLERQVRMAAGSLVLLGAVLALVVDTRFALLSALVGGGLLFAGITDTCGLAMLLSRLPYNRPATCDVAGMVHALTTGAPPAGLRRAAVAGAGVATSCASPGHPALQRE